MHAVEGGQSLLALLALSLGATGYLGQGAAERGLEEGLADEAGNATGPGIGFDFAPVLGGDQAGSRATTRLGKLCHRLDAFIHGMP